MLKNSAIKRIAGLNVPPNAKLIYLLLSENVSDNTIKVRRKELADTINVSRGTVTANIKRLAEQGHVIVVPTYNDDGGRSANKIILL